ncbi:MAG TPA: hypothetical protein VHG72_22815 [Polyangia bacterium]|nr:hypothetical protein [Polyangia bacterium]
MGSLLARRWGAPWGFGLVAAPHLVAGALILGSVSRKLHRTRILHEAADEVRGSVRALVHPTQGEAS